MQRLIGSESINNDSSSSCCNLASSLSQCWLIAATEVIERQLLLSAYSCDARRAHAPFSALSAQPILNTVR